MEENNRREKDAIDNLKPKAAFKAGLFTGLGVMFAIGFFILLGMMLNDKDFSLDKGNGNTNDNDVVVNNGDNNPPPAGNTEIIVNGLSDGDWVRGDKNAEITIVEFSDVDCPFCTRFHNTTKQVLAEYEGRVNFVFRHFPLTQLHPEAFKKAEAAECVGEQGGNDKFWSFMDKIFEGDETLSTIADIAASVGVDKAKFQECLDSGKYTSKVQSQSKEAQAAGGRGTPYSIIITGDQKIPIPGALPFESVKTSLDALLK
ncbi:MAG: DsbA family protein [Candidatus Komeilibacteria bacterium]|jgi:protein-disulfide isomerase|nr:DsbA family protein [Candidatus Komeilibacteria bacterium]MBT4447613.1 DsbA family protein [Candidatus Komeilibacteria bacterium]